MIALVLSVTLILTVGGLPTMDGLYRAAGVAEADGKLLHRSRNFFAIVRILELFADEPDARQTVLKHGSTNHGKQYHRPDLRGLPVSYFGIYTGVGMVMSRRPEAPMHVGVMGLGAGALAAYGRPGDRYQFYEIDPDVIRVSSKGGYFSYLSDSPADVRVIAGDARLSLERQLLAEGSQAFDLLVLDAFSSDAVPTHLITREAVELYVRHLAPHGVLVAHISNKNLDLGPLLFRLAEDTGLHAVRIENLPFPRRMHSSADWIVLAREPGYVEAFPRIAARVRQILGVKPVAIRVTYPDDATLEDAPLWTDDYSDLLSVLEMRSLRRLLAWNKGARPADEAEPRGPGR